MTWRPRHLIDGYLDNRTPGRVTGELYFHRHHLRRWRDRVFRVELDLAGDLLEDVRGLKLRFIPDPQAEREALDRDCTLEGFAAMQRGEVGDITLGLPLGRWTAEVSRTLLAQAELRWDAQGLYGREREEQRQMMLAEHRPRIAAREPFYPLTDFPYLEFFSEANGRVVIALADACAHPASWKPLKQRRVKTPAELFAGEKRRQAAFRRFVLGETIGRGPAATRCADATVLGSDAVR